MKEERCPFPEKEKIIKMKERSRKKVEECDPIAVKMLDTTTRFLEDTFSSGGKMCFKDYEILRHQITTLATKFSNNCSCIEKKNLEMKY